VLGNLLDLKGFEYLDTAQIRAEIAACCAHTNLDNSPTADLAVEPRGTGDGLTRIGDVPIYAVDSLVRRSAALQDTLAMANLGIRMHPDQARALGLAAGDLAEVRQGGAPASLPVLIDDHVPLGCARVPSGVPGSEVLGDRIAPMTVVKTTTP
jgi:NADH-quinone oxidoreductase subunit G